MSSTQIIKQPYSNYYKPQLSKLYHEKVYMDHQGIGHFTSMIWEPVCELLDCGMTYQLTIELPGVDKQSLSLQYLNNWIIVSGNKQMPTTRGTFCFTEIIYGQFKREIPVPLDSSKDGIQAKFQNGYLTISLNKINTNDWVDVIIDS